MSQRYAADDPEGLLASHGWQAEVIEYGEDGSELRTVALAARRPARSQLASQLPHHGIPVRSPSRVLMADR